MYKLKTHFIKLFLAPVIWGGALVAGRVVAASIPPFTTTFLRFSLVSLFMLPTLYLKEGRLCRPSGRSILLLTALSITGVLLFNVFLFSGLRTVTAIRSSVIIAFTPAVVALISGLFFHERIRLLMAFGIVLAFIGAVITITNGDFSLVLSRGFSIGDIYLLGCVLSWAVYSIIAKHAMVDLSPLTVLTYSACISVVLLIPFTLNEGGLKLLGGQPTEVWFSLLYLSIGAAGIAYLWYYEGIKVVGASKSAVFLNLEPVAAISLGILILGEKLSLPVGIGAVLVISGLFLTNYQRRHTLPGIEDS